MTKGRKPLPTKLKVLKGTDQPCRINKNEPTPPVCFPDPPKEATAAVKKFWPKIAQQLYDCGILTEIDAYSLSAFCEVYLRWVKANKKIASGGPGRRLVVKSPTGCLLQSPWLSISNRALDQMQKIAAEFGMTPSSRTGISVDPGLKKKKNRFANLS